MRSHQPFALASVLEPALPHPTTSIAIQISKEAASAVVDMPGMQMFPVLPFLFLAVYAVWWVIACVYIASVQTKSSVPLEAGLAQINPFGLALPTPRVATTTDQRFQYLLAYQFFHLLWY